jgi:hypothetical protein
MKALTLWQPWAWALLKQLEYISPRQPMKRIETRSWKTNYQGPLAIHAAKFKLVDHEVYQQIESQLDRRGENVASTQMSYLERAIPAEMFGAVLGVVTLADCVPIESLYGTMYDTPLERACGDWSPGRYGWIFTDPVAFSKPVPETGRQGLWNWYGEGIE